MDIWLRPWKLLYILHYILSWKKLSNPANISTLFQRCLWVDVTKRCGTTSNQRCNNVYFNVGIYNVQQHRINVVYFSVDMNNVRQRQNNIAIFNAEFHNVAMLQGGPWSQSAGVLVPLLHHVVLFMVIFIYSYCQVATKV